MYYNKPFWVKTLHLPPRSILPGADKKDKYRHPKLTKMTEPETENTVTQTEEYAKFWPRAGAYVLDNIVIALASFTINSINIAQFKSFWLYLLFALIAILYKPLMEARYGATLGKMILNLRVTNTQYNSIDYTTSFLRSLIFIVPPLLYVPFYYLAFQNADLDQYNAVLEFGNEFANAYPLVEWIGNLSVILLAADVVVLLTDKTKTQSSLHDRIAKTYVIQEKK
ncbi:RDD family protein [Leeuwenhoekiella sp. A2]|uniref:RDD family protein n=1 Tax=Leeuwenhoekiella sp. A2 TaxID=3141460 RepID=UPI003A8002B8